MPVFLFGGEGEIRTHGTLRYDSFQDCCLKPLGHLSIKPWLCLASDDIFIHTGLQSVALA